MKGVAEEWVGMAVAGLRMAMFNPFRQELSGSEQGIADGIAGFIRRYEAT